jgi:hypothetical protein
MDKFTIIPIEDTLINKYLIFKNLFINRKYSSKKNIIKKIDHYQWWLQKQKKENLFLY